MEEIDVSECSYYNKDNYPYCCEIWDNECEAQNCYYKQLLRKEKECDGLISEKDFYLQKIEVLKQALQEIKEIATLFKKEIKLICKNCAKYDDCHACCVKDYSCYKYNDGNKEACKDFELTNKLKINNLANNILQKISEVEE